MVVRCCTVVIILGLLVPAGAGAQAGGGAGNAVAPQSFGLGVVGGLETVPAPMLGARYGSQRSAVFGVRAWAPLGTDFQIMADLTSHGWLGGGLGGTLRGGRVHETTLSPTPAPLVDDQPVGAFDRFVQFSGRIGHPFGHRDQYRAAVGLARILSQGRNFVVGGLGYRRGEPGLDRLRWGVDVELSAYRSPWDRTTYERDAYGEPAYPAVDRERYFRATLGLSVRLAVELPSRRPAEWLKP